MEKEEMIKKIMNCCFADDSNYKSALQKTANDLIVNLDEKEKRKKSNETELSCLQNIENNEIV